MRLTSLAAGILTLAIGVYPVASTIATRAAAAPRRAFAAAQEEAPPGPMGTSGTTFRRRRSRIRRTGCLSLRSH